MVVFTTGQVAKICKVAPRTVSKWFDSGRLKGYRIPGSQDRRIPREYLVRFMKEYGMPLGNLEVKGRALIVSQDGALTGAMKDHFSGNGTEVRAAASGFEAGMAAGNFMPHCIVIDTSLGETEAIMTCSAFRRRPEHAGAYVIFLLPDGKPFSVPESLGVNESFRRPFDPKLLFMRIGTKVHELVERE